MKGKQNQIVNLPTRTYEALTSKLLSDSSYLNRYTAKQVAKELGLQLVPGVEISVSWNGVTIHIVGLNIDPAHFRLCLDDLVGAFHIDVAFSDGGTRQFEPVALQFNPVVPEVVGERPWGQVGNGLHGIFHDHQGIDGVDTGTDHRMIYQIQQPEDLL